MELNKQALFKVRGDIHSGEIKKVVENISVTWPLQVLVTEDDGDELWNLTEGDSVEVGPFKVGSLLCASCWTCASVLPCARLLRALPTSLKLFWVHGAPACLH